MKNILIVTVLGVALFGVMAWQLELFKQSDRPTSTKGGPKKEVPVAEDQLGGWLYEPAKFAPIELPKKRTVRDPIVVYGAMNAFEVEDVPSQVPGMVLFVGEQVDPAAVMVAGSAPFLAEPYYSIEVPTSDSTHVSIFYRRLYEGQTVKKGQMLGMVEHSEALGGVTEKIAKIAAAEAEYDAATAGEKEGYTRYARQDALVRAGAGNKEDLGGAFLTWKKLQSESTSAREKVKLAAIEKNQADVKLKKHEIRATLPYETCTIKAIQRPAGTYLKQLDPVVLTVQNLSRLLAEGSIEEQYYSRFKDKKDVTATIEPTVLEAPAHEWSGHNLDVNCVVVAKDMRVLSAGEDGYVLVWSLDDEAPSRKLDLESDAIHAVKSLACTPTAAQQNLCAVGYSDGTIAIWDLADAKHEPLWLLDRTVGHGDNGITALAFSPDGAWLASGASDGSIRMWTVETGKLKYAFIPANGVAQAHEEVVTSLHFTPQCRLVSAGRDKTLRVWRLKENGAVAEGKALRDRDGNIRHLGVSEDGQWMLFDQGRTLRFLSVEGRNLVHSINLPQNAQPFDTLAEFSPDGSLLLTAGQPEGRMQLWRTPDAHTRAFEVRQFAPRDRDRPVACAAFSPLIKEAVKNKKAVAPFAVSASGSKVYLWTLPTPQEVKDHRIENVPLTIKSQTLDSATHTTRIGFEIANPPVLPRYPSGRFEAGRPVTIVID